MEQENISQTIASPSSEKAYNEIHVESHYGMETKTDLANGNLIPNGSSKHENNGPSKNGAVSQSKLANGNLVNEQGPNKRSIRRKIFIFLFDVFVLLILISFFGIVVFEVSLQTITFKFSRNLDRESKARTNMASTVYE